jgi:hypothetical protein
MTSCTPRMRTGNTARSGTQSLGTVPDAALGRGRCGSPLALPFVWSGSQARALMPAWGPSKGSGRRAGHLPADRSRNLKDPETIPGFSPESLARALATLAPRGVSAGSSCAGGATRGPPRVSGRATD